MDKRVSQRNVYSEAASMVAAARKKNSSVIVGYSGGKDSLVVLDLCAKAGFQKIVCFINHFLPNLKIVQKQVDFAKQRYGVEVYEFQDPDIFNWLAAADYNDRNSFVESHKEFAEIKIRPIVQHETGIRLVATGHKRSDGMNQGVINARWANKTDEDLQPIISWNKFHVLSYLKSNNIPIPENDGRNSSSMDLHPQNILWLYKKHPEDYQTIKKVFPYVEAIVKRKEWYNIPKD